MTTAAREIAARHVARRARRFPDLGPSPLDEGALAELDGRDAALAMAIDHAAARHWLTLTCVLESRLQRTWENIEPKLQAVLLTGAAQLLYLDRVPDHAAISQSVELAKSLVRAKAGGLVNAVLRKVADLRGARVAVHDAARRDELPLPDGGAWRLAEPIFDTDDLRRLAQQTSHPMFVLERWRAAHGWEATRRLAGHSLVHGPIIIAGVEHGEAMEHCRPHRQAGFAVFEGPHEALAELLARHDGARVQDPASAAPIAATGGLRPSLIVDACAGRGTKTAQLAALHPGAEIIATDTDERRRATLAGAFASSEQVCVVEPDELGQYNGRVDLLVLDVPCSNTGVLGRRVEAKYRLSAAGLASLTALQRQIVADTILLPGEGGCVLYATCSVEEEESAAQAAWIVKWHSMRVVEQSMALPEGGPGDDAATYRDGGGWSLLARRGR